MSREQFLDLIRAFILELRIARFASGLVCPRCGDTRIIKWGFFSGRQRYRCKGCKRTFSDLTGTPAAYIKKLWLWPAFGRCMRESLTLRPIAKQLGIQTSTAFDWRHRNAGWLRSHVGETLMGFIELELLRFAYSRKGERKVPEPRRRGIPDRGFTVERPVRVVIASDRIGNVANAVFTRPHLASRELDAAMISLFQKCSGLVAGMGLLPVIRPLGVRRGIPVIDGRISVQNRNVDIASNTGAAALYARVMLDWLDIFCGVATKYLPNYLAWHATLDRTRRQSFERVLFRWNNLESVRRSE